MRENSALGIQHPEWVDGRRLWLDPEVKQIVDWLENGYPPLGWEGDAALALFLGDKGEWVLNRYENGRYRTVCRCKPGVALDARLIMFLVEHDLRRKDGESQLDEIEKYNDKLEQDRNNQLESNAADKLEKLYWGLGKDIGYHY